jgi:hypothetical protein
MGGPKGQYLTYAWYRHRGLQAITPRFFAEIMAMRGRVDISRPEIVQPRGHMKEFGGVFVLVIAEGGFIWDVAYYSGKHTVVSLAERLWSEMDPETDDLKVFDSEEHVVWQPPREA